MDGRTRVTLRNVFPTSQIFRREKQDIQLITELSSTRKALRLQRHERNTEDSLLLFKPHLKHFERGVFWFEFRSGLNFWTLSVLDFAFRSLPSRLIPTSGRSWEKGKLAAQLWRLGGKKKRRDLYSFSCATRLLLRLNEEEIFIVFEIPFVEESEFFGMT